jgi:hypothetical protein
VVSNLIYRYAANSFYSFTTSASFDFTAPDGAYDSENRQWSRLVTWRMSCGTMRFASARRGNLAVQQESRAKQILSALPPENAIDVSQLTRR